MSGAALPPEFRAGMQIRLDDIPTKFLVGVKNLAAAAAATRVVAPTSPSDGHHSISPGKHDIDTTVVRKAAGCVVEDLNGDPYTLRNKSLSTERISRVGGGASGMWGTALKQINVGPQFRGERVQRTLPTSVV